MIMELKESVDARSSDMYNKQYEITKSATKLLNASDDSADKETNPKSCGYWDKSWDVEAWRHHD